jgi:hypothetical protein
MARFLPPLLVFVGAHLAFIGGAIALASIN